MDKDLEKWLLESQVDQSAIQRVSRNTYLLCNLIVLEAKYMYCIYDNISSATYSKHGVRYVLVYFSMQLLLLAVIIQFFVISYIKK